MITGKNPLLPSLLPLGILLLGLASCHESKYLSGDQALYIGNKVKVVSSVPITRKQQKALAGELDDLLRPKLNDKFLGFRLKLWIYNIAGHPKKNKGFKHWLKYKVGQEPVLASPAIIQTNADVLQSHLENKGWFRDTVVAATFVKDKHLIATYTAQIGPRYTIRNITYPDDSDAVSNRIDTLQRGSLLKKGEPYDLDNVKAERIRIDSRLKNHGFYYFNPDYLVVELDTALGAHQVDMFMRIKDETPDAARTVYSIGDVFVYADYGVNSDTSLKHGYITPEGYHIVDTAHYLRPIVFRKTMVFQPGNIYREDDHNASLSRLVNLGVFRFVKARLEPASSVDSNDKLNAYFYLVPTKTKSFRFEVTALTRSDNTTGSEFSVSWRHRNLFHGAELFTAKVYTGVEGQSIGIGKKVSTYRAGLDLNLYFPRIISPFDLNTSSRFVPRTRIETSYDIFAQSAEYTLNSSRASFGYIFKNRITSQNELTVLGINYVHPTYINPQYQLSLDSNIMLRRAIEPTFIIGPTYNFTYSSLNDPRKLRLPDHYYFNGNIDLSNNLLGVLSHSDVLRTGKQQEIFGVPFAQYARFAVDFHYWHNFSKYNMIGFRANGGIGISYGNSSTMPFIKEFFGGGTDDIRAFRSRALGPGNYYRGNPNTTPFLPDQPGDIKLMFSLEYRASLVGLLRWAIFTDAGNVWTLRPDTSRPGSVFTPQFLNDFAVGVGTGLRFDFTIVVLRVDVAAPVRYPWHSNGSKWNFRGLTDISEMVFNLAVGYPF
ncbi:translocation and assembly module lipoprotein TamL [Puia dinghuensis]|uniref:Membrane protein n=1 Tax=Puia dinghuensis TaxID=1792502 RepID=A0A8J2UD09_9BACT|nr:BamA/TamA family outer membrane protein [Puia dinghuensis]GGA98989.1 membrane protein [Puia dinghuensis]